LDRGMLEREVGVLFQRFSHKGPNTSPIRVRILEAALELSPRVGPRFAKTLLDEVLPAAKQLPGLLPQVQLLEKALLVAAQFDEVAHFEHFVAHLQLLLGQHWGAKDLPALSALARQCSHGLRKMTLRDSMDKLMANLSVALSLGKTPADVASLEN